MLAVWEVGEEVGSAVVKEVGSAVGEEIGSAFLNMNLHINIFILGALFRHKFAYQFRPGDHLPEGANAVMTPLYDDGKDGGASQ